MTRQTPEEAPRAWRAMADNRIHVTYAPGARSRGAGTGGTVLLDLLIEWAEASVGVVRDPREIRIRKVRRRRRLV